MDAAEQCLTPCGGCGGPPTPGTTRVWLERLYTYSCAGCGKDGSPFHTAEEARSDWNERLAGVSTEAPAEKAIVV